MKLLSAGALFSVLFLACTSVLQTAGGTTDTGNARIIASVYLPGGAPASSARVVVRRFDYLGGAGQTLLSKVLYTEKEVFTDDSGRFQIDSIDTGSYSIEVNNRISSACLLQCRINRGETQKMLNADTIRPYAKVQGSVAVPSGISGTVFVQVYGLERCVPLDAAGHFSIADLPAGCFSFRIGAKDTSFAPIRIDSVKAVSGADAEIPFTGWQYHQRLWLNTSSSGAGVAGAVYDFPVAIRLSRGNFDFSHAAKNGADLRFTKANGAPLPYEIEQWDSAAGAGVVWVKLDTVFGNTAQQYLVMYSGFPGAASGSSGAAVFDTGQGFQGVWHLDEAGNALAKDATVNGYDGTPYNMMAASLAPGVLGGCRRFDGSLSYISMSGTAGSRLNFPQNGSYTISAWAYVDTFDSKYHVIAGKGHEQYYIKIKCFGDSALWEFDEYEDKTGWAYTEVGNPPDSRTWVYLVGVRSGTLQQLYINGALASNTFGTMPGTLPRNTGDDFTIGKYLRSVTAPYTEGYCAFGGMIDEVCVSSMSKSADWIKLCYMNQRTDDRLVVFDNNR